MSDEFDDEDHDPQLVVVHQPIWRSKREPKVRFKMILFYFMLLFCQIYAGLTEFLHRLDVRYDEKVKKDGMIMAKKQRKVGAPASCKPPADAPEWAVDAEWRQQQRMLSLHMHFHIVESLNTCSDYCFLVFYFSTYAALTW